MKRYLVLECGSDQLYVHVHEVTRDIDSTGVVYRREATAVATMLGEPGDPKFFGQLNSLLVTRDTISKAALIIPVTEVQPAA